MNIAPLVSVILPAWNASRTIQAAINSVLQQSVFDLELIVCNDASTDTTEKLVQEVNDPRIFIINNQMNMGPGQARDQAISLARGQWVALTDADDIWAPDRLENMINAANSRDDVLVFDDTLECHDAPAGLVPWRRIYGPHAFGANGKDPVSVSFANFILQPRSLIHPLLPLSFIRKFQLCHSTRIFFEDTEFYLQLIERGIKLIYIPKAMYYYRLTPGSLSAEHAYPECKLEVFMQANTRMQLTAHNRAALEKKIHMIKRELQYFPFLKTLKMKQWGLAIKLLIKQPSLFTEFLVRLYTSVPYQIQRLRHQTKQR
nr:glycosyltransferase family 2 protein [Desulfobulbus rhabdoformis]